MNEAVDTLKAHGWTSEEKTIDAAACLILTPPPTVKNAGSGAG